MADEALKRPLSRVRPDVLQGGPGLGATASWMNLMERSFDPTVFTKNRKRLLKHRVGQGLFDEVVWEADRRGLLSDERLSVDGTLIEAVVSIKSFRRDEGDEPPDDAPGRSATELEFCPCL